MLRALSYLYLTALAIYLLLRFSLGDSLWWSSLLNTFAPFLFLPLPAVLLLAVLLRLRAGLVLASVLGVVALGWFGPYFSPARAESGDPDLTVVTYNMHTQTGGLEPWLLELQPDLVLLQEVPYRFPADLSAALDELYPRQVWQDRYNGNMILSRHPVLNTQTLTDFGEYAGQRIEISVEGQRVAVYNLHLAWPIGDKRLPRRLTPGPLRLVADYDDRLRNSDVARLVSLLEQEPLPFVAAGDFNLSQHAATYTSLSRVASDAFRDAGRGWGNSWRLSADLPPVLRIDYIWHGSGLSALTSYVGPTLASDHLPVVASLSFN